MKIRFGPAGIPIQCNGSSTLEGVECCANLGLSAMEIEFVHGVRMSSISAESVAKIAKKLDVSISSHAPYYVNLCSKEAEKIQNTKKHIIASALITHKAGGEITVFHPGFYQKLSPKEAYETAKKNLIEIESELKQYNIKIRLGAETVGKKSAFGGLDENIHLSQDLEMVCPVVDFAHVHARGDEKITCEDGYRRIFDRLETELGDYVNHFHCHFSEVEYTEKGERKHMVLGTKNEPPFKPFMKLLAENGYSGTVICETPQLDLDVMKMQEEYNRRLRN